MKWNRFVTRDGDWHEGDFLVIGDISGLRFWASEVAVQWDGAVDHPKYLTERHPQDLIYTRPEVGPTWGRPDSTVYTNGTNDGSDL